MSVAKETCGARAIYLTEDQAKAISTVSTVPASQEIICDRPKGHGLEHAGDFGKGRYLWADPA